MRVRHVLFAGVIVLAASEVLVRCRPTAEVQYHAAVVLYDDERVELRRIEPNWKALQESEIELFYWILNGGNAVNSDAERQQLRSRLVTAWESDDIEAQRAYSTARRAKESRADFVAYRQQQKRVEVAKQAMDDAKAKWIKERDAGP